jgi:hypothetical protein
LRAWAEVNIDQMLAARAAFDTRPAASGAPTV